MQRFPFNTACGINRRKHRIMYTSRSVGCNVSANYHKTGLHDTTYLVPNTIVRFF